MGLITDNTVCTLIQKYCFGVKKVLKPGLTGSEYSINPGRFFHEDECASFNYIRQIKFFLLRKAN